VSARADAADFVSVVRQRLLDLSAERGGRPGLVTVAYDTELFGHWWHEGPVFLEEVLRRLPEAGVRLATLRGAVDAGHVGGSADLGPGSWGSGKDWRVWEGEAVADLVDVGARTQKRLLDAVDSGGRGGSRRPDLDQLARDTLLALSSDWAFMVTKNSAAQYARERAARHTADAEALARAIERGHGVSALVERQRRADGPFGSLDARLLRTFD
jgi:1,4-alpha-glucan branching enzyme